MKTEQIVLLVVVIIAILVVIWLVMKPKASEPGCKSDTDCPNGKHCNSGTCVECSFDSDCPGKSVCRNGTCSDLGGDGPFRISALYCDGKSPCVAESVTHPGANNQYGYVSYHIPNPADSWTSQQKAAANAKGPLLVASAMIPLNGDGERVRSVDAKPLDLFCGPNAQGATELPCQGSQEVEVFTISETDKTAVLDWSRNPTTGDVSVKWEPTPGADQYLVTVQALYTAYAPGTTNPVNICLKYGRYGIPSSMTQTIVKTSTTFGDFELLDASPPTVSIFVYGYKGVSKSTTSSFGSLSC